MSKVVNAGKKGLILRSISSSMSISSPNLRVVMPWWGVLTSSGKKIAMLSREGVFDNVTVMSERVAGKFSRRSNVHPCSPIDKIKNRCFNLLQISCIPGVP